MSPSITASFLRVGGRELISSAGLSDNARFTGRHHCVNFSQGCRGENPGPQACAANTLLSEPSGQPHAWGFNLGLGHSHRVYVLKAQIPFPICSCKAKKKAVLASRWPLTVTGEKAERRLHVTWASQICHQVAEASSSGHGSSLFSFLSL